MVLNVERGHLSVRNLLAGRIVARIEDRLHDQASRGLRATNESDHCVPSPQRHAAQLQLIWLNSRCSIGFHFEQPVG